MSECYAIYDGMTHCMHPSHWEVQKNCKHGQAGLGGKRCLWQSVFEGDYCECWRACDDAKIAWLYC